MSHPSPLSFSQVMALDLSDSAYFWCGDIIVTVRASYCHDRARFPFESDDGQEFDCADYHQRAFYGPLTPPANKEV